jgi:hypothetical protein
MKICDIHEVRVSNCMSQKVEIDGKERKAEDYLTWWGKEQIHQRAQDNWRIKTN